jgi:hypothetical protein
VAVATPIILDTDIGTDVDDVGTRAFHDFPYAAL